MKKLPVILAVALMISTNLFAQNSPGTPDKKGCKDYPGISRFIGATIHDCSTIDYGIFYLGLDQPIERDFNGHGQFFKKYLEVKGKITNIQYLIPLQTSVLKVYENYDNAMKKAAYNVLYSEKSKNSCFYREDYYGGSQPFVNGVDDFYGNKCDVDYYYTVYAGVRDSLNIYVVLLVGQTGDEIIVNQSVIETVPLELNLVSADNIAQNIELTGHSIFYDIHFTTGSAVIDAKSDNQMKQIAEYLNAHKDKKFYIVGHTDNVGDFASNMTLSENRGKAVMNELVSKYNVDANQLKAYGVANLSPVTSNKTDAGKARNRRVEIVEQ
ncbi:MAG: OmpA family protein [Bacteroidales bacterium]|nr:OmpA family protein [Bacteroidales bacterium]